MKRNDIFNGFTLVIIVLLLLTLFLNIYNGRFLPGDFQVYYSAAGNFLHGAQVYQISFDEGSGYYKYSPSSLFLFLPYLLFNFKTAAVIHIFILGAAYWYSFMLFRKLIKDHFYPGGTKHDFVLLSIAFGCILLHFTRELYLGNINIILLMLCSLSILKFLTGKYHQGGILLGIVVLLKPYLLILLLPLVLRKKWRALAWLGITIGAGLISPFLFTGMAKGMILYKAWLGTMLVHDKGFPGMTSLDYFFNNLFPWWPDWGVIALIILIFGVTAMFILNNIHREKRDEKSDKTAGMNFLFEWFLLLALLPNLIKTDWVLLLFCAPLITFMVFYISSGKQYWWIPILVILLFFYGANSDDLLGKEFSHAMMQTGLMGLSNFLLAIVALLMFIKLRKTAT